MNILCPSVRPHSTNRNAIRPLLGSIAALCALATAPLHAGEPLFGLDAAGTNIIQFDSTTPGTTTTRAVTGLVAGDTLSGIDFRPANGILYGVGQGNRLYTLNFNGTTVQATQVGATGAFVIDHPIGVDFNPVPDRLRVVSVGDVNLRVNPNDGTLTLADGTLAYALTDVNAGQNPTVQASAYTNNFAGATTTTLYGIDTALDILVRQDPPNAGTLNTVGALGFNANIAVGLDISGLSTTAFLVNSATGLYTVNLATGAATLIGPVGVPVGGLAALPRVPLVWDVNGTVAGVGGSGNWDVAALAANWTVGQTNSGPTFAWPNTNQSDALFTGTAGTVNVIGAGIQVRNMAFNASGYAINGPNALGLNASTVTVTNLADIATINAALTNSLVGGSLTKAGSGTLVLTGANTYSGGTTLNGGTLRTQSASALGSGAVTLNAGVLAPSGPLNVGALTWNGGQVQLAPAAGDMINVAGTLTNGGGGGTFALDSTGLRPGTYTLATFGTTNFTPGSFAAEFSNVPANVTFQSQFLLTGNQVQLSLQGAAATGPLLQNSAPVNIPIFATFLVSGPVQTGGPGESNTVAGLVFTPDSALEVLNTLTVTRGPVDLVATSSLHLNDSTLSASQLRVLPGGLLHGNGTINGSLFNAGLVSPGNSPGQIRVTGHYTQTSTGTLRIEIGGTDAGEYDRLVVAGRAQLDGTLELVPLNDYRLERGDQITFLTAGQGVDGEFATVRNPFTSETILQPTVVYGDDRVTLELVRGSYGRLAEQYELTPNQRAVAGALDCWSAEQPDNKALVWLDGRKLDKLPGDFDDLAPEELTSIFTISTSLATVQSINLQRRTDDLRTGASGFSAGGLAMQGTGPGYSGSWSGAAGPSGKESKELSAPLPPDEKKWGAFVTGVGEWVDVSGDGNARGYDITTGGFTLGLDYKLTPNFALGLAAGYAGTGVDLSDDGSVLVNGGKLGLYATYFTGGFYVDAAVNGGYNSYDTKRHALQGTARASTEGGELNVLVGTGYDWKIGALSIGPTATFNYTLVGIDGTTEHGSLAPLDITGRDAESVRSAFGFKASADWRLGGVLIKPEIRAAWQHEYGDRSYGLEASFASGASGDFLVHGPAIGRDSLLLGAGFAVQLSERAATYVYYDGELGRDRYDRHSVSGGLRVAF
jgi:autotransporter-associated beta strand protein